MRILIIGATGMLGQALSAAALARTHDVSGAARRGADINLDLADDAAVADVVGATRPDVIVNAAAITDHDICERDPALANRINAGAVAVLADAARKSGAKLVQISTDQYWTGDGAKAHAEDDPPSLIPGTYARTKHAAEAIALDAPGGLVLRTNITGLRGDPARPTFIEWVFATAERGEAFRLFDDYFGSTLDTGAFSDAVLDMIDGGAAGLYHVASRTVSSKKDFILDAVRALTGQNPVYEVASVRELETPRAESAGLSAAKTEAFLGRSMPDRKAVIAALVGAWRGRDALT